MSESRTEDIAERLARLEQQDQRLTQALELLARHEAPAKPGRHWDGYAAVIAALIGVLALLVSGYTAHLQREQLRAQMWPRVQLEFSTVHETFAAINQGTGPARITAMRVAVHGVPLRNWRAVERAAGFTGEAHLISSWLSHAVLTPGQVFTIIQPGDNAASQAKFKDLLPGEPHALAITVCYCSVLDDCWVTGLGVDSSELPEACPITAAERFTQ